MRTEAHGLGVGCLVTVATFGYQSTSSIQPSLKLPDFFFLVAERQYTVWGVLSQV